VPDDPTIVTMRLLQKLLGHVDSERFQVRLWDGRVWAPRAGHAQFTIVLQHPGALRAMLLPIGDRTLAEAYAFDDFDIEGDIAACMPVAYNLLERDWRVRDVPRVLAELMSLPRQRRPRSDAIRARLPGRRHSRERDRAAIDFHYSRSNSFYSSWLDDSMTYTCAYFRDSSDDLETAQRQKMDYLCRKLGLEPGHELLDIGCGWGGLAVHAAKRYGARVHAITLSTAQAEWARDRVAREGLSDRCRIELRDFRDLPGSDRYDRVAGIGVVEHLGATLLPSYFETAWRLLRSGGVFLSHGQTRSAGAKARSSFFQHYVFPDGELVTLAETLHVAEAAGFEVRDVENLREHYAMTVGLWRQRLEAARDAVVAVVGEQTYRVWRLYLAGIGYAQARGRINLHQILMSKSRDGFAGLGLTRADWYAPALGG
jgi:cyclopropane-fatty-acyl-phospholipid synthase